MGISGYEACGKVSYMFSERVEIDPTPELPAELHVPDGRERLGRAHQLRVDISIVVAMTPSWLKRALADRNGERARGARVELVERIACALERRFRITWLGSDDTSENARAEETSAPLFGGPDCRRGATAVVPDEDGSSQRLVDSSRGKAEHRTNI